MTEQEQQPTGQEPQAEQKPPWGDDFDPQKAWNLIQNLRADKEKLAARPVLDDDAQRRLAEYDQIVEASKSDLEKTREELTRWQTEAERWRGTSVASTVKAIAAADVVDPDVVLALLDTSKYLGAGGEIDEQAIKADLNALLDAKPYLRREKESPPRTPRPNPAQGTGGAPVNDPAQQFAAVLQGALAKQ